jgi:hypothetical protein
MDEAAQWHLGRSSERYESGGKGPATISTGEGDAGGISYGQYQLSSAKGTVAEYLAWSRFGDKFDGLEINSADFKARWKELANTDPSFGTDQHDFIKTKHYDVQVAAMKENGLDLSGRGPAVQDAIWSTSVQYRNLTPGVFQKALDKEFGHGADLKDVTDQRIVEVVQDYKENTVEKYFASSPALWTSLKNRAASERESLSEFARTGTFVDTTPKSTPNHPRDASSRSLTVGSSGGEVHDL